MTNNLFDKECYYCGSIYKDSVDPEEYKEYRRKRYADVGIDIENQEKEWEKFWNENSELYRKNKDNKTQELKLNKIIRD